MVLMPATLRTVMVCVAIASSITCGPSPAIDNVSVTPAGGSASVSRYEVFELAFKHNGEYHSKFLDVALEVTFTSPTGVQRHVKGFFYGDDLWKVRFVPDEVGRWTYEYTMIGKGGLRVASNGAFESKPGTAEGPVRRHSENPHAWVLATGPAYFPIGLNDCFPLNGLEFEEQHIDGEGRTGPARQVSLDEYFTIYGQAGFNLLRFSQQNCSFSLFDDLDHYRERESLATDELLLVARKNGLRVMFGLFGYHESRPNSTSFASKSGTLADKLGLPPEPFIGYELVSQEKRFLDYAVARWGAYVDLWELVNERNVPDQWTTLMARYLRSVDPYDRPISTSWAKPELPDIDINSPHWYEREDELQSDQRVVQQARTWKSAGKPVIVGEQGNTGMNWDPRSGRRMRIRTWTALFQEISLVFWNTSWSKAGMFEGRWNSGAAAANIYLGPEERRYVRVLRDFATRLDAGVRMSPVDTSLPDAVRAFGLRSHTAAAAYLHHFASHVSAVRQLNITMDLPPADSPARDLVGEWIEPETGRVVARVPLRSGRQTIVVPPFTIDLAFIVESPPMNYKRIPEVKPM